MSAGDPAATTELGLTLFEGIQDRTGRALVRCNAGYAVRLFQRVADTDATAATMLAYAYDVGEGARRNTALALKWYRRAVGMGSSTAASNMATIYRDHGNSRLAHRWVMQAADMGDGDAAVRAGYNWLYGIGVRRNASTARRMFRDALRSDSISAYGREEALYHVAVADLDSGKRRGALPLLRRASSDGDYPEAQAVLAQITAGIEPTPCRCIRHLNKGLRGHARCPLHP